MSKESYIETFHPLKLSRRHHADLEAGEGEADVLVHSVVRERSELIVSPGILHVPSVRVLEGLLHTVRAGIPDGRGGRRRLPGCCGASKWRLMVEEVGIEGELDVVEGGDDEEGGDGGANVTSGPLAAAKG